jgi:hypothetical protein
MQRANDIASCGAWMGILERTTSLQHDRLTMAANVGYEFYARWRVNQGATVALLFQAGVIAYLWDPKSVPNVARSSMENAG